MREKHAKKGRRRYSSSSMERGGERNASGPMTMSINVKTMNVKSMDMKSMDVKTMNVKSMDMKTMHMKSMDMKSMDVKTMDMKTELSMASVNALEKAWT